MVYSSSSVRNIGLAIRNNYTQTHLEWELRAKIISLRIPKQPRPPYYQRSRADKVLFRRIYSIITLIWKTMTRIQDTLQEKQNNNLCCLPQGNQSSKSSLHIALVNIRSVRHNILALQEYITDNGIDICPITETWLKSDEDFTKKQVPPDGYEILSSPRGNGKTGGGIALVYHSNLSVEIKQNDDFHPRTMETTWYKVKCGRMVKLEGALHWCIIVTCQ